MHPPFDSGRQRAETTVKIFLSLIVVNLLLLAYAISTARILPPSPDPNVCQCEEKVIQWRRSLHTITVHNPDCPKITP